MPMLSWNRQTNCVDPDFGSVTLTVCDVPGMSVTSTLWLVIVNVCAAVPLFSMVNVSFWFAEPVNVLGLKKLSYASIVKVVLPATSAAGAGEVGIGEPVALALELAGAGAALELLDVVQAVARTPKSSAAIRAVRFDMDASWIERFSGVCVARYPVREPLRLGDAGAGEHVPVRRDQELVVAGQVLVGDQPRRPLAVRERQRRKLHRLSARSGQHRPCVGQVRRSPREHDAPRVPALVRVTVVDDDLSADARVVG